MLIDKIKQLNQKVKETQFSGVITLSVDNDVVYECVSGMAFRDTNKVNTKNTLFAIASGSKFLTALGIGKLIDEDKLSLDTKAKDVYDLHMDWIDPNITIKQLLSHTSGMSDYLDEDLLDDSMPIYYEVPYDKLVNPKDFIPIFSKDKQKFRPGEKFNYNNQAFVYLAIIIEEITKVSYKNYMNNVILKPLNIYDSGIYHVNEYPSHTAMGYLDNHTSSCINTHLLPYQSGGDGGAIFSAGDMKTLWEAFFDYKIISKALVDEYVSIHATVDEKSSNFYGLGVWLKKDDRGIYPYLLGGDPGISFSTSYRPITKTYMFQVSNTSQGVWDVFDEVVNVFNAI